MVVLFSDRRILSLQSPGSVLMMDIAIFSQQTALRSHFLGCSLNHFVQCFSGTPFLYPSPGISWKHLLVFIDHSFSRMVMFVLPILQNRVVQCLALTQRIKGRPMTVIITQRPVNYTASDNTSKNLEYQKTVRKLKPLEFHNGPRFTP